MAFKRLRLPRPVVGDWINDEDLIWKVTEVRLITGKEHVGVNLEPADERSKAAVEEISGETLIRAGWEVFHPKADGN